MRIESLESAPTQQTEEGAQPMTTVRYDRVQILFLLERATVETIDARHFVKIRGLGQEARWRKAHDHIGRAITEMRLAQAGLGILLHMDEKEPPT